ncbi:fluoride efflux transporter CrcB [Brachybacterium squillarum]|uniref:fluoride efflux transporter CrcB n=1 Tax=Brachybacterium squillarum TaxID=661979 RepID=UPI002221E2F3|nr:fluoride efflux transporter CrcB [Brachybacterium squillarum]MCW1806569.1 fluoride efflux transporter CrcB [Brachybacterium squillarum]
MSPLLFVLLSLAGGLGAATRFALDGVIRSRAGESLPWGTILINVTGSFLLGLVTGMVGHHLLAGSAQLVLGTGFLGGYTTFSTASLETVRLLQAGRRRDGIVNALGTLVAATTSAAIGLLLGSLL